MSDRTVTPFHLAIPVSDISRARDFYTEVLGCTVGRSDKHWVDLNLYGHQLVCHVTESLSKGPVTNPVDGHEVPVPHFGVVLDMSDWRNLAEKLTAKGINFVIEPHVRFEGQVGEQGTLFFLDPDGNAIEFKGFQDIDSQLFDAG